MELSPFDAIAGVGAIEALEQRFKEFVGTRFAVAMSSCTSALDAALLACGVKSGDEVIAPAFTWGGSIAGVLQRKAVPVFADIDETLTLDPEDVERRISPKIKAVIAVHLFGSPCDMERLIKLCRKHGLFLIEDCAQAIGTKINGGHAGTFGIGCFSFGYGKPLRAGEGGMITTDDENLYDKVLYYTQHPLRQRKDMFSLCEPNEFSVNYRLNPVAAKMVLEGFEAGVASLEERKRFFETLHQAVVQSSIGGLTAPGVRNGTEHSWYRFSPAVDPSISEEVFNFVKGFFAEHGCQIESGYVPRPLYQHRALAEYLPRRVAKQARSICLSQTEAACRTRIGVARL